MKYLPLILAMLSILASCSDAGSDKLDAAYRLSNGHWYDGQGFVERSVVIVDGRLSFEDGGFQSQQDIDLEGRYVIPALCEGHNHNLGDTAEVEEVTQVIDAYMGNGVFYSVIHGSFNVYRAQIANLINSDGSVDVVFSTNGITGPGGHPRRLREFLFEAYGNYSEFTLETLADAGYFEVETEEELLQKWPLILAERPDFIKVMLLFSDEYERRRIDPEFFGNRGLNPDLLPALVALANDASLRVSAHVENEADMIAALQSGVDIVAHLPSHDTDLYLSDEAIALAGQSDAYLVTTLSLANRTRFTDPDFFARILEAQRSNLSRLHQAGARLVIGSDNVRGISFGEVSHLTELGVLTNSEILNMWTSNCTQMAYPGRQTGALQEGYEASFLVLDENPLDGALTSIPGSLAMSMKRGQIIRALSVETSGTEVES